MIEDYGIDGKDISGRTILEVLGILASGAQMGAYGNAFANGFAGAAGVAGSEGKSETSYGESSGKLNWDAIVSKKGETRVDHINRHAVPNNSRETHGVFNGNPIDMVNELNRYRMEWEEQFITFRTKMQAMKVDILILCSNGLYNNSNSG